MRYEIRVAGCVLFHLVCLSSRFEFRKKHGSEVYEYSLNGKTYNRSLDTWLKIYVSQEEKITLEQMKNIVKFWQTKNPDYDAKSYRKSDSSVATTNDYIEKK